MATKMTALRLEEETWTRAKLAARHWALRNGLRPEGKLTEWLEATIARAAEQELLRTDGA